MMKRNESVVGKNEIRRVMAYLGSRGRGVPKNISAEESDRRREALGRARQIRMARLMKKGARS